MNGNFCQRLDFNEFVSKYASQCLKNFVQLVALISNASQMKWRHFVLWMQHEGVDYRPILHLIKERKVDV